MMDLTPHCVVTVLLLVTTCVALDNGVARRPPMGWMSWVRFGCHMQCIEEPKNCISERLYMTMADIMVREGYLDAGYDYVSIDDCWMARDRDSNNRLQADPIRFPSGIKALADYVHARGLKLGIYADVGVYTCAGLPGSLYYLDLDARTFAEWGVDMLKLDGCHASLSDYAYGFPAMGVALNRTGRRIVYSCQWPMYARYYGGKVDYAEISRTCNMFRALTDIYDSFYSVQSMIDYLARDNYNMSYYAGPGAWNDPDQIVIGNFGLSLDEMRVQMAMWSMWSSPLIMSNDLRYMSRDAKSVLLNRDVIAIDQDELGNNARIVLETGTISAWTKPVTPTGSVVIAVLNRAIRGYPLLVKFTMSSLKVPINRNVSTYHVTEVFDGQYLGRFKPTQTIAVRVNPSGVYLVKAVPVWKSAASAPINCTILG